MSIRRSDEEWSRMIRDCKSSGLSDAEWLRLNHISPSTYYNKLKKLYGEMEYNAPIPSKKLKEIPEKYEIVRLSLEESSDPAHVIPGSPDVFTAAVIVKAGGCTVEISNQAGAKVIKDTLLALQCLC